ncbi:hypothetical protein U0070_008854 [Myodes glareolus]|uniref:PH domain-containing protein n=1 Tax=Myodes glareolus TaxID=447135 RepID=A0AAW0IK66_MYOGA
MESKDKMMRGSRRGCVRLRGAVIGIDDEDDSTFTITVDQKTFHFQARDADEREKWIHALEETILRHTLQLQIDKPITGVCDLLRFGPLPRCFKPELHSYTIWILQVLHKPPTLLTVLSKHQAHGRSTDK